MPSRVVPGWPRPSTPTRSTRQQVVSGDPQVASLGLVDEEALAIGVWEHSPGVSTDVEVDEVFVVLAGRATIEVEGGPTLEVGPATSACSRPGPHPVDGPRDAAQGVRDPPVAGAARAAGRPRLTRRGGQAIVSRIAWMSATWCAG